MHWQDLPDPAVSVPSAKVTKPPPTAAAEPDEEPPLMNSGLKGVAHAPYGDLVPTCSSKNHASHARPAGKL